MCRAEALGRRWEHPPLAPSTRQSRRVSPNIPEDGQCPWPGLRVQAPRGICVLCDTTTHAAQQLHQGGCWFWRIFKGKPKIIPTKAECFMVGRSCQARLRVGILRSLPV